MHSPQVPFQGSNSVPRRILGVFSFNLSVRTRKYLWDEFVGSLHREIFKGALPCR